MLSCPRCAEVMPRRKSISGWSWVCPTCGGRTATIAMLRKVTTREAVRDLWTQARGEAGSQGVTCPSCRQPMTEVSVSSIQGVEAVDVCTRCHFVWFDEGEMDVLPVPLPTEPAVETCRVRDPAAATAAAKFALSHQQRMKTEQEPAAGWKWVPGLLGLPVEWNAQPLAARPWATWSLTAVVTIVSILAFGNIDAAAQGYGFVPAEPLRMAGLTLFTSFFLHIGWGHLVGNMWFLLVFGDNVEDTLGRGRFLLLLAVSTVVGDLLHMAVTRTPGIACIGASGGISGVLGYYALRFPRVKVGLLFFWVAWIRFGAIYWFVLWIGMQFFGAWMASGGVAYGAHLGGAAVGVSLWAWERWGRGLPRVPKLASNKRNLH